MSYPGHRRSFWHPYGNQQMCFVHTGNAICARACMLICVALCRGCSFFVENPLKSALDSWPYLNFLMHQAWLHTHRTSWFLWVVYKFSFAVVPTILFAFCKAQIAIYECHHPRLMGFYGGWSLKPQLGLSNAWLGSTIPRTNNGNMLMCFCFVFKNWVWKLRIWASYLNQPMSSSARKCLRDKAEAAGKCIVKVTINKETKKKTSWMGP